MDEAKKEIWAGIDVGKRTFVAALDDFAAEERKKVTSLPCRSFKRNQNEAEKFFHWIQEQFPEAEVRIVMETTGCYSERLAGWIRQLRPDIAVTIENAGNIHAFIQSLNLPHKTDRLDAQAIARFGTERQPEPTKFASKTVLALRELTRTRAALVKAKVEFKNRQETLSEPFAIEINKQTIALLEEKIKEVDLEIKKCAREDDEVRKEVVLMSSLHGVSFLSACEIIATFGSLKQYSAKELSALSGLAPYIKESGTSVHSSYMSRKSSGRVRQILYLDSIVGIPKIPALQEFQERLLKKGKKKMTVRVACMRKMLLILRSIVVHQRAYDENYQKKF